MRGDRAAGAVELSKALCEPQAITLIRGRGSVDTVRVVYATSGKAQLAYECVGNATGTHVLLIHAGVTDRRSWHRVVERLVARHRCIGYDARGYGDTRYEPEDGWSPVGDAVAVLDAAGCARACVVACSAGGQTGIDLALARPERVAALLLIGTGVRGAPATDDLPAATAELVQRIDAAESSGDLDLVNQLEAWLWLDGPSAPQGRVGGNARELFLEMNGRALHATDPGEPAEIEPAWPRLHQLACPTLVMVGALDHERIQSIDSTIASMIPGAAFLKLDGVAHLPHLEGDPVTLEHIDRFTATLG